jgi:GxxExxY protein
VASDLPGTADMERKSPTTEDTESTVRGHGLIHGRTTNTILAAAYTVHTRLGPGLLESAYKACLIHELNVTGLRCDSEKVLPVHYEGVRVELGYRVDLIVDDAVIIEVKAVEVLLPVHEAQLLSYLRLSGKRVGLLINFNVAPLKDGIRRRVL